MFATGPITAEIVVADGPDRGLRVRLGSGPVTIGRGLEDDVLLWDTAVTRCQLVVEWDASAGCHAVVQAGDSLSAFNGVPAGRNAGVRHLLADGDRVQIGGTVLRYFRPPIASRPGGDPEAEPGAASDPAS